MKVAQIQFAPWDKIYNFDCHDFDLKINDLVVVKTNLGTEVGKVVNLLKDTKDLKATEEELKPILRKVTTDDLNRIAEYEKRKFQTIKYCRQAVERHQLLMKIIDVHFSFDGGRLTFAFIADSRVDFRELVKDLTHHFQKSIRLQQIGIRDEAKMAGDIGCCGRQLCCKTHLRELVSVTSDLADLQQISHRGSDRLSGICGRLRCCLVYEKEVYQKLSKELPAIGSIIKTPQGKGEVIDRQILKKIVVVAIDGDKKNVIEAPIK